MASIESYTKEGIDDELDKKSDKTHKLEDHPDWPGQLATERYVDNAVSSVVVNLVEDPPGSGLFAITAGGTDPT